MGITLQQIADLAGTTKSTVDKVIHNRPGVSEKKRQEIKKLLEEYGVWKCVYGHLHGMPAYNTGIRGNFKGIEYILASYDFIGGAPKVIYDSGE